MFDGEIFKYLFLFTYLAALGLSCSMQELLILAYGI